MTEQQMARRLPARFRDTQGIFLFAFCLILLGNNVIFSAVAFTPGAFWSNLLSGIAALTILVAAGLGAPKTLCSHLFLLVALADITFNTAILGGLFSPVMFWFTVIPIPALLLLGRLGSLIWWSIALLVQGLIYFLTATDMLPAEFTTPPGYAFWSMLVFMMVSVSWAFVPIVYQWLHRKTMNAIAQRNAELEITHDQLLVAQRHKDEFIASISHELRTPMNAILGFNEILRSEVRDTPRALEVVEHVRQSADHLLTVINDILDYSQLQSGELSILEAPFPLREVAETSFNLFQPRVDNMVIDYRLQVADDLPAWVSGDRHRLIQVLVNLLGNAIKFTHQGSVMLSISRDGEAIRFAVTDTGIGIPPERQTQIFNRFEQADQDTNRRYGGTGLGLSISERLVTLQGGKIGVVSKVGQGSSFWFTLPLPACDAPEKVVDNPDPATQSMPLRLLIVDDNKVNRMVAMRTLQIIWPDAVLREAGDGLEALAALRNDAYDVVLMDMVMPEMDGIEATQAIRTEFPEPQRSVPVLALTANVNPNDRERCLDVGMNDIILKPFDKKELASRIESLVRERKDTSAPAPAAETGNA